MTTQAKEQQQIISFAKKQGFDLVGFTEPKISPAHLDAYKDWLQKGYHADMNWMENTTPRQNLDAILPGIKNVIVLATNYYAPQKALKEDHLRISHYAHGRDYHKIIKKRLTALEGFIGKLAPHAKTRAFTDTGPVLERALAEQAGLGFIGKNSSLITPEFGSWVFISTVLTTLPLSTPGSKNAVKSSGRHVTESEKRPNLCGRCTLCLDACPTRAITAPRTIDANKCIAYHTIENRNATPPKIQKIIDQEKIFFGCDICQKVCPHNRARQQKTLHKEFQSPPIASDQIAVKELSKIFQSKNPAKLYTERFAGSALMRAKKKHTG